MRTIAYLLLIILMVSSLNLSGQALSTENKLISPWIQTGRIVKLASEYASKKSFSERAEQVRQMILNSPDGLPVINSDITFTAEELDSMFIKGQVGYGEVYVRMQEKYGINPIWNAAIDAAESGHFTYFCAKNNVSGFGFNGVGYKDFTSIEACIEHKSKFLAQQYLTPGGMYYRGTSITAVSRSYNDSDHWRRLVADVAYAMIVRGERAYADRMNRA